MAVSTIAGIDAGGVKLACILYEGVSTVTTIVMGPDGYTDKGIAFASPLVKDAWVTLDIQTDDTYVATHGLPVVKAITNGSLIIGKIVSDPKPIVIPSSTPTATWAAHLTGRYYRVATVWFPGILGVTKMQLQGLSAANIVPGVQATLEIDASLSVAAIAAGNPETLVGSDVTSGGVGMFSFHYVASGSSLVSILAGFTGGINLICA